MYSHGTPVHYVFMFTVFIKLSVNQPVSSQRLHLAESEKQTRDKKVGGYLGKFPLLLGGGHSMCVWRKGDQCGVTGGGV